MCGKSWYQFSMLGIQCPTLIYVMFVWSGLMGGFLSILSKIPV